jgi:hypothetical protein
VWWSDGQLCCEWQPDWCADAPGVIAAATTNPNAAKTTAAPAIPSLTFIMATLAPVETQVKPSRDAVFFDALVAPRRLHRAALRRELQELASDRLIAS